MERNQFIQECINRVKNANIDDLYLSSIGFDISKNKGVCPVHSGANNKNGFSFTDKKGYRQYSCWTNGCIGQGVDIIHLCKVKENLSNEYEAVKYLANMFNIELPTSKKEYTKEEKQKFYVLNKLKEFHEEKKQHLEQLQKEALKDKDVEKALNIGTLISELNINTLEYSNYSKYKPTKIYEIDKYISENIEGLQIAFNEAKEGKKVLVLAPTGSGKTDTTIKNFKNIDSCFISPNASNVEQIVNNKDYGIPGAFNSIGAEETFINEGMKGFTWDKFASLEVDLSNTVAIVDEIHQTFNDMYRNEKIKGLYNNLSRCKGRIDITATPNKLDLKGYDLIIEYKQKQQTKYNVNSYKNINDSKILDIINNSKKFALFKDDSKFLDYIKGNTNKKVDVINSDRKDSSKAYNSIMTDSNIGDFEGIANTRVIVAGVNIYDKDITDIIIIGEKDISTIKQYVARFRDLKEVNVHIFNNYKEYSNTYNLEYTVEKIIKETQGAINSINYLNKLEFQDVNLKLPMMKLEKNNNFYLDENTKEYKIDIPGIRNFVYTSYYNNADIVSFNELLKEYFNSVNKVDIEEHKSEDVKEFKKNQKEIENEAIQVIENHLDIIVGANEILKNRVSSKLNWYLVNNNLREDKILDKLKENNLVELLKIDKIKKLIDLYTKYVIENNFTYEFAWHMATLGNRKRGKIFNQLNGIVYREVMKEVPGAIDNKLVENRLYNLITQDFKPGISYTSEHLQYFIEAINIMIPGIKLSTTKVGEIISNTYDIEKNEYRKIPQLDYNYYRNMSPNYGTKKINLYTIRDYKSISSIVEENNLSSISQKSLENIAKKRFQKIVESDEVKAILDINKIFAS